MYEALKKYLLSLNCAVINPVKKSLTNSEVVGWYCKSTSVLKLDEHISLIKDFISENKIGYFITEDSATKATFFIYINKEENK